MAKVKVRIVKLIDDNYPGWVECELTDITGQAHVFRDKLPIFSAEDWAPDFALPETGSIRCRVLETNYDKVIIDTGEPDDVESLSGLTCFSVSPTEVS